MIRDALWLTKISIQQSWLVMMFNLVVLMLLVSTFDSVPTHSLLQSDQLSLTFLIPIVFFFNGMFFILLSYPTFVKKEHFNDKADTYNREASFFRSFPILTQSIVLSRFLHSILMLIIYLPNTFIILSYRLPEVKGLSLTYFLLCMAGISLIISSICLYFETIMSPKKYLRYSFQFLIGFSILISFFDFITDQSWIMQIYRLAHTYGWIYAPLSLCLGVGAVWIAFQKATEFVQGDRGESHSPTNTDKYESS